MKIHTMLSAILLMVCSLYSGINWAEGGGGHGHGGGHGYGGGYGHGGGHGYGGGYGHGGGHGYGGGYGYGGHGYSNFGFYFGAPFYSYPYYSYPYQYQYPYYPPAVVAVPATPPVYIQKSPPSAQQYPSGYWYYCDNPEGYYPYIKECPTSWRQVEPIPPAPR